MGTREVEALRATAAVCERLGLSANGLYVLRASSYVAVRIPATPYLARVGRAPHSCAAHGREMAIARALADAGAPVARPAELAGAPVVHGDWAVGLWRWIEAVPGLRPAPAELGQALRAVHHAARSVGVGALDVPPFAAPAKARSRIRRLHRSGHLDDATAAQLEALVARSTPAPRADDGLVHGDFRRANVLATAHGPLVIDFDAASIGPQAWDLTLFVQEHRHFGLSKRELDRFLLAYGDVPDGLEDLCRLRDAASAVWALAIAVTEPAFLPEARRRAASVLDGDDRAPWSWAGLPSARPAP